MEAGWRQSEMFRLTSVLYCDIRSCLDSEDSRYADDTQRRVNTIDSCLLIYLFIHLLLRRSSTTHRSSFNNKAVCGSCIGSTKG